MTYMDNPWIPLFLTTENLLQPNQLSDPNVEHFVEKAANAIDLAKHEITFGETISNLLLANENELKECHRSLATIGIWHFECSVELFNKAIRNFEKAKKEGLLKNVPKGVDAQIKACKKQINIVTKQKDLMDDLLNSISQI